MTRVLATLLLSFLMSAARTSAATIEYEFEGSNSGLLGGVAYTDATFTITAFADTASPDIPNVVSFSIAGVGSGTISGANLFVNHFGCDANQEFPAVDSCVGITISNLPGGDLVDVANNVFDSYILGDPIGPVLDATSFGNVDTAFPTSAGDWIITSYGPATFRASVPEPATLILTLGGLVACGLRQRKRRQA